MSLADWIVCNVANAWNISIQWDWSIFFGVAVWLLWHRRNQLVFNNKNYNGGVLEDVGSRTYEIFHSKEAFVGHLRSGNKVILGWHGQSQELML